MALLSVVILGTTGYAWSTLRDLNAGLSGQNIINEKLTAPDGATDILLVGNDSRTDAQGNPLPEEALKKLRATDDGGASLTDTMILVRIPNGGQRASAISFPRDTRVEMPNNYGKHKLNSAYPRAKSEAREKLQNQGVTDPKELEKKSTAQAQRFLVKTINKLSGVSIDHYAEVNLMGFYQLTKAVGGVKVCLKEPVDDSEYSGAVFPEGPQNISGSDALAFVRQRHGLPRGDLDRIVRQQVFMSGLAKKILSAGTLSNPAKLSSLMNALKDSITLGKDWDVVSFAQRMQGIAGGNIKFHTIPVELEGESGKVTVDPDKVKRFADNLLLPPEQRKAKQRAQQAQEETRSKTTVNVYNASNISNLASRVLRELTSTGFTRGKTANADSKQSQSTVEYAPGHKAAAQQVAKELGGLPLEQSSRVSQGTVAVYLGDEYSGPGTQKFAAKPAVRLDGASRQPAQQQPAQQQSSEKPITAEGVPCVY